jgi:multidrug transporter EmrE-like cation transporter
MNTLLVHIIAITILDVLGVICGKFYSINKNNLLLAATCLFFGAAGFVFAKSLKYEGMAITNVLWIALSVLFTTIIGYFFFKEEITSIQFIGIAGIMVGLVLINLK